ncbi:beige protein [Ceratobasidium sp. AG-Ba]|nr:beige protein [Ceratobasidium sp. AG-Ba]
MTCYRRHCSSKHGFNLDYASALPHVYDNRTSHHDIVAVLGKERLNTLKELPFACSPPKSPEATPPAANPHLITPQPPEHSETDTPVFASSCNDPTSGRLDSAFHIPSSLADLPWFDPSKYNKIVDADGLTRYVHKTAGRVLRKDKTRWEKLAEQRTKSHPNSPWYPFASEAEWKLGYWLATCKSSQSKIDEFLEMDGILAEQPKFGRAYNLFHSLETDLEGFGGPDWVCQPILPEDFPDAKHEPDIVMYHRDVEECLDLLAGRPDLDGEIWFHPEIRFAGDDEIEVFDQMPTGHLWHKILHEAGQDPNAALGGAIFGSDRTHLTHYAGDVKVHALYVSLGNILKETRAQTSKRAWMLVAYIPICKWENTLEKVELRNKTHKSALPGILSRRLFHFCMEIICEPLREINVHEITDPQGNVRLIFYVLIAYLADLEEQYVIAALDKSNCIHCVATTNDFGSPEPLSVRTSQSILDAISRVQDERHPNADPYHFSLGAGKERLCDVEYPFWAGLPFVDICQVLSVDLLHSFYKYFFDHPFQWNVYSLGEAEIDARMKAQISYSGARSFPQGVTHISQMSCKEHRALMKVHLSIIANSTAKYSRELTLATRALLDYLYYAQLPSHTEHTLRAYVAAYEEFHRLKNIWIKNESRRGEKVPIGHFNIPKMHAGRHLAEQIRAKGAADNFSTETIEHLHIDTIKEAYPATNKKEWEKQTLRWLVRSEKVLELRLFLTWKKKLNTELNMGTPNNAISNFPVNAGLQAGPEAVTQRSRRGGFAPETTETSPPPATPTLTPTSTASTTKKRKRQIDDPDDKEERTAKKAARIQQAYALSPHQDVALRPSNVMTIGEAQQNKQPTANISKLGHGGGSLDVA